MKCNHLVFEMNILTQTYYINKISIKIRVIYIKKKIVLKLIIRNNI